MISWGDLLSTIHSRNVSSPKPSRHSAAMMKVHPAFHDLGDRKGLLGLIEIDIAREAPGLATITSALLGYPPR
jgi:hypothetical protein